MVSVAKKLRQFLDEPMDLERLMPESTLMGNFNRLPWQTQRTVIESQNTGRKYKPLDIRKYPNLAKSGVQIDPHRQKVCPVCYMVIQRTTLRRFFGGQCPKCGCHLEF